MGRAKAVRGLNEIEDALNNEYLELHWAGRPSTNGRITGNRGHAPNFGLERQNVPQLIATQNGLAPRRYFKLPGSQGVNLLESFEPMGARLKLCNFDRPPQRNQSRVVAFDDLQKLSRFTGKQQPDRGCIHPTSRGTSGPGK